MTVIPHVPVSPVGLSLSSPGPKADANILSYKMHREWNQAKARAFKTSSIFPALPDRLGGHERNPFVKNPVISKQLSDTPWLESYKTGVNV